MKKLLPIILLLPIFLLSCCTEISEENPMSAQDGETAAPAPPSYPVTVGSLTFSRSPETAASLSPAVTEIIYEMGFGDKLVCRSVYCDYPEAAKLLPTAGSSANPDIKALMEISPEVVITQSPLANTDLALLKSAGIAVLTLPAPAAAEELYENYRLVGQIFAGETEGAKNAEECTAALKSELRLAKNSCTDLVFIMEVTDEGFLAAQSSSFAGDYISRFGRNAAAGSGEYLLTHEELVSADPQVIFLARPLSSDDIDSETKSRLSAFENGFVYVIDSSLMQRPTSRLAGVTRSISAQLRQDIGEDVFTEGFAVIEDTQTVTVQGVEISYSKRH